MKGKISLAACAVLAVFSAQANAAEASAAPAAKSANQANSVQNVELGGVEINSVGDNISESGISEGFLTKKRPVRHASGQKGHKFTLPNQHRKQGDNEPPRRNGLRRGG
nr:hypothetical protein [uncultured Campylobacter sp.]